MSLFFVKVRTAIALGAGNLCRALGYRLGVKIGLNPVRRLTADVPTGPFFAPPSRWERSLPSTAQWAREACYYGRWPVSVGEAPPDWHLNPLTGVRVPNPDREWWRIEDFDTAVGDIKSIWEASRFDWALAFSQRACHDGGASITKLNQWLTHWCLENRPYYGPNWKCGQESSIRVLHLAMSAVILDQHREPLPGLVALITLHLKRIEPTISYAIAQDNNHGTSEAAALYVGGSWLMKSDHPEGERWYLLGRRWLENRVERLVESDGSFSQYSVNYHRVMLDTLSITEVWRQKLELPVFSVTFKARSRAAVNWLYNFVDESTGDVPNIGANDGARLLPLTDTDFRDFRPSVQLAMALFCARRAYSVAGAWDYPLQWLGLSDPVTATERPGSQQFDQGGYAVLRQKGSTAILRYPRFRFRPGQADALHLDLWHGGCNLLRDAGSFGYNVEAEWLRYFPGTASHNTVEFDGRDQMPRLSRFLFGDWLSTSNLEPLIEGSGGVSCAAGYRDGSGAAHTRHVCLGANSLQVRDQISGFAGKAVLRWRLAPGDWLLDGNSAVNGAQRLSVTGNIPIVRCELVEGWESRYYLEKTPVPVLEVEVADAGILLTEYHW
ncbi:Heparinase II/III-like protein [compost metagenome]